MATDEEVLQADRVRIDLLKQIAGEGTGSVSTSSGDIFVVADESSQLAKDVKKGDIIVRTDESKSYKNATGLNTSMDDWQELLAPSGAVLSVNEKTGDIVLNPDDLDDTSTANKFVTDAEKNVLSNISGTNTGDQDLSGLALKSNVLELDNTTEEHEERIGSLESAVNPNFLGLIAKDNGSYFEYERTGRAKSKTVTESTVTGGKKYISDFDNLQIYNEIKRVILDNDGNEVYQEGESGYDDTLSSGGLAPHTHWVAVKIPKFYFSLQVSESPYEVRLKISKTKLEGMDIFPAFQDVDANGEIIEKAYKYISAFEGTLVDNVGAFRFADKSDSWDRDSDDFRINQGGVNYQSADMFSSVNTKNKQCPVTEISLIEARQLSENRGHASSQSNASHKLLQYWDMQMINVLFAVEFGTFQWQTHFSGVSNLPSGSYNESVSTGYTSELGSDSGYINASAQRGGASRLIEVPSYRGIENPFGNVWKFLEGIKVDGDQKIKLGIYDVTQVNTYSDYAANDFKLQKEIDPERTGSGYYKYITTGGSFIPHGTSNGGSSSYFDYVWRSTGGQIALAGANWYNGSIAGGFALYLTSSFSSRYRSVGGRFSL